MELDTGALQRACYEVAKETKWETRPVDTNDIKQLADELYRIASERAKFVAEAERDPNLVTRAVRYLAHVHAIPPMKDDTSWFREMLDALVELACPNTGTTRGIARFFYDIETGIAVSRALIQSDDE